MANPTTDQPRLFPRERALYIAVMAIGQAASIIPSRLRYGAARFVAIAAGLADRPLRRRVASAVTSSPARHKERRTLVNQAIGHTGVRFVEMARLAVADPDRSNPRAIKKGVANLDAALTQGHGAVLAFPHAGSWHSLAPLLASAGYPVTLVLGEVTNHAQARAQRRISAGADVEIINHGEDGLPGETFVAARSAAARGRVVLLAGDVRTRSRASRNVSVELMDEWHEVGRGAALLAREGVPLLTGSVMFDRGRWVLSIDPAIEFDEWMSYPKSDFVSATMQMVARRLTEHIERDPAQWSGIAGMIWSPNHAASNKKPLAGAELGLDMA